jgi:hypothetical protein
MNAPARQIERDEHGRPIYRPDGAVLREFLRDRKSRVKVLRGPIGSGKSRACCQEIWQRACEQQRGPDGIRKSRWAIVRNTYPDLEGTTVKTWLETFPEEIYGRFVWAKPFTHHIQVGDVDLEVFFFALDKDEDVRKLRSLELTGIWFNEAQYIEKVLVDESDSRVGRYPPMSSGGPTWHGMILDMNEPGEDHWLPLMMGEVDFPDSMSPEERRAYRKPDSWAYYPQPPALVEVFGEDGKSIIGYKVNPAAENTAWLVKGYYRNLIQGKSKAWIDSRLMNRISVYVDGKPVWTSFVPETHVAKEVLLPVPGYPILVGLDFGRSPAAIFGQEINGKWRILAELVMYDVGATTFAPEVKRVLDTRFTGYQFRLWGDPKGRDKTQADERTAYDVFASFGMPVQPAPVKQNNIQTRIEAVEFTLNQMRDGVPRFLLSPACRVLKVAMAGKYHFRKIKATGRYSEEPEKDKYSQPADALQYLLIGGGEGRAMTGHPANANAKAVNTRHGRRSLRRGR